MREMALGGVMVVNLFRESRQQHKGPEVAGCEHIWQHRSLVLLHKSVDVGDGVAKPQFDNERVRAALRPHLPVSPARRPCLQRRDVGGRTRPAGIGARHHVHDHRRGRDHRLLGRET